MKFHTLAAFAVAALIATPALAGHCPKDVQAIDAALAENPPLSSEQQAEVKRLRDEGDRLHKAGQHGASLEALHQAMEIIELEHSS